MGGGVVGEVGGPMVEGGVGVMAAAAVGVVMACLVEEEGEVIGAAGVVGGVDVVECNQKKIGNCGPKYFQVKIPESNRTMLTIAEVEGRRNLYNSVERFEYSIFVNVFSVGRRDMFHLSDATCFIYQM